MLARIWGYCNSAACLHQSWFQCQQFRVLQDPLLLADLYQRIELSDRPASKMNARVVIGSRVTVRQLNANDKQVFHLTIVEPSSANLQRHKISYLSPMGLALLSLPLGATFYLSDRASESHWCVVAINSAGDHHE